MSTADLELAHELTAALTSAGHQLELVTAHADALLTAERGAPRAQGLIIPERAPPEGIIVDLDGDDVDERLLQRWRFDYGPAMVLLSRQPTSRRLARRLGVTFFERPPARTRQTMAPKSPVRGDTLPDALWAIALLDVLERALNRATEPPPLSEEDESSSPPSVRTPLDVIDVLLVEDEADIRAALSEALETEGYSVACAENGCEALELLRRRVAPRVILLDLMMPVMDGWTLRDELRRDARLRKIPIAVTSALVPFDRQTALRVDAVIGKPVDLGHLLQTLERLMG